MKTARPAVIALLSVASYLCAIDVPNNLPIENPPDSADLVTWPVAGYPVFATNSVLHAGSWLQDAPAGRHGSVKAMPDGSLAFEDGTPVRFWGSSTVYGGTFPDKREEVPLLADAIAARGYNLVRFHHNDIHWKGIGFLSSDPASTVLLDPEGMDRLDYFASELIKRGIYIYLDLVDYRPILEGEGIYETFPDMRQLKNIFGWKGLFPHPVVVDLWKRSSTEILNHVNPYTGRKWGEEPAVATIEIINENGPFWDWGFHTTDSVQKWHDAEWNRWLVAKYGTREALDAAWTDVEGTKGLFPDEDPANGTVFRPRLMPLLEWDRPYRSKTRGAARINDYYAHLADQSTSFFKSAYDHLRSLGYKGLILGSHELQGPIDLKSQTTTGTVGAHLYARALPAWFARPSISGSTMDGVDVKTSNWFSNIQRIKAAGLPSVNGEWTADPVMRRADANIAVAAATAFQDVDQSLHFCYYYRWSGTRVADYRTLFDFKAYLNKIAMSYNSSHDIPWMAINRIAAALFIRDDFAPAKHTVEIAISDEDVHEQNLHALGISGGNGTIGGAALFLPLIHNVQCRFFDKVYDGDADVVFATGRSASGDYSKAKHAVIVGDNPYADRYHKRRDIGIPAKSVRPDAVVETLDKPVSFTVDWPYDTPRTLEYNSYEGAVRIDSIPTGAKPIGVSADGKHTLGWLDDRFLVLPNGRAFATRIKDTRWLYRLYLEAARRWKIDIADNDADGSFYRSDTRQMTVDWAHGTLVVDTPRTQGFSGLVGWRPENETANLSCTLQNPYGNVMVTSADGEPISTSKRMLLIATGGMQNTDQEFGRSPSGNLTVTKVGKGPCLVEAMRGSVSLRDVSDGLGVYALDHQGRRIGRIETTAADGKLSFSLSPRWQTIVYEIADPAIEAAVAPAQAEWPVKEEELTKPYAKPELVPLADILTNPESDKARSTGEETTEGEETKAPLARFEDPATHVGHYSNIKISRVQDPDQGTVLQTQFGKVTQDWSGGIWMICKAPDGIPAGAVNAIGMTFRGDGTLPRDTILTVELAGGVRYKTAKNINSMFERDDWRDVLFKPEEFVLEPDSKKKFPDAPERPDLSRITRFDFVCVGPLMSNMSMGNIAEIFLRVKADAGRQAIDIRAKLPSVAPLPNAEVAIPFFSDPGIQPDGMPEEAAWSNAVSFVIDESKVPAWHEFGSHVVGGKLQRDETAAFWLLATTDGLAMFVDVDKGGVPITAEREKWHECDAVEVFSNPDRTGLKPAAQIFLAYRTNKADYPGSDVKGVRVGRAKTQGGYALEAVIPWNALGFNGMPKTAFGIEFQIDFAAPGAGRILQMTAATGTNEAWISSKYFLRATVIKDPITIEAGNVRGVVVPERGGRLMELRFAGGNNLLWNNVNPENYMWKWRNDGGEKTWIGPQEEWEAIGGSAWPPPESFDGAPFEVTERTDTSVSLLSPSSPSSSIRVSRKIEALPDKLVLTSVLMQDGERPIPDFRITNWSVTQLPPPPRLGVRLTGQKRIYNGSGGGNNMLPEPVRISDNAAIFYLREADKSAKCNFDGDLFLAEVEGGLLSIRQLGEPPVEDIDRPPERGQLYIAPKSHLPAGYEPYVELELAKPGIGVSHQVEYCFMPTPAGMDAEEHMKQLLQSDL